LHGDKIGRLLGLDDKIQSHGSLKNVLASSVVLEPLMIVLQLLMVQDRQHLNDGELEEGHEL
jgi:hypothetical protein